MHSENWYSARTRDHPERLSVFDDQGEGRTTRFDREDVTGTTPDVHRQYETKDSHPQDVLASQRHPCRSSLHIVHNLRNWKMSAQLLVRRRGN